MDDTYFDKNKAQDFALKDLISFMATKSGENILHMMSQIKYHEDGQFLSSLQRRKEISNYVGLYLILYPSSDEYFINIASLKIDNFGNVEIRSNVREKSEINTENVEQISTYSGFVYLFEGIYLAIRMETKDNKPFYFQYIVHNRPTSNEASNVFQGLRVSLSKDNHPIASRVVLVKIEEKAADTLEYTRIPLFTNKSTYENFGPIRKHLNSSTFPTKLAHYLTGHIDNFIKHEVKTHTFERDNYGEILHAAACHFADKDEEKFIATLKKAKLHGYKIQIDKFKQYDWFINLSEKCLKRLFEIELLNSYAVNNAESLEN